MKKLIVLAALAASTAGIATAANATVVTTTVNLSVPNTVNGVYVNVVTGATGTSGASVPGYDFNPYKNSTGLTFFSPSPNDKTVVLASGSTVAADLSPGTVIGASSFFNSGVIAGTQFQIAGTHIVGFSFLNEATGITNYGYATLSTSTGTTGSLGFPATIISYSYENSGGSITVAGVPEASSWAMMLMGLGMVGGVMRHRAKVKTQVRFA